MFNRKIGEIKVNTLNWGELMALEGEVCVKLTNAQIAAITALIETQRWPTRWYNGFDQDVADGFVDDIIYRLQNESECLMPNYTLEPSPDGSIVLLADGVPVSTVDLKALLDDDYINIEGDVMEGELNFLKPTPGSTETAWSVNRAGNGSDLARLDYTSSQARILTDGSNNILLGHSSGPRFVGRSSNMNFQGFALGLQSGATFIFYAASNILSRIKAASNAVTELLNFQDENALDVASISRLGVVTATERLVLKLYSSTATWRDAFKQWAFWNVSTDATRRAGAFMSVANAAGDHIFMTAMAPEASEGPLLAFRGEEAVEMPTYLPETPATAIFSVIDALNAQGLSDIEITYGIPPEAEPANNLEKCRMAYYVVSILIEFLLYTLDNLTLVTPQELMTGQLDNLNVFVDQTLQINAALQLTFNNLGQGGLDGIRTDLEDNLVLLAEATYDLTTITKAQVKAAIDASIPWAVPTAQDIMNLVVDAISDEEWAALLQSAVIVPAGIICDQVAPCDGLIDFRFDPLWAVLGNGALLPGVGFEGVLNGGNVYADFSLIIEDCAAVDFAISWESEGDSPYGIAWGHQTWDGAAWVGSAITTQINKGAPGAYTETVSFTAPLTGLHRLNVQTQTGGGTRENRFVKIEWEQV